MPVEAILSALPSLPTGPGVYRMINASGKDVYIGKAKNLQKRVTSYTQCHRLPHRLRQMVHQVVRVGIITTPTEIEALLLEAQLIKRYQPDYNILLKNGHPLSFLSLSDHPFPRLQVQKKSDTSSVWKIGPFLSRAPLQSMMDIIHKGFLLRSCTDQVFAQRSRPCLQHYIKRCSAPCVKKISEQDYAHQISELKQALKGKMQDLRETLQEKMQICAQNHAYDQAALLRDQVQALSQFIPSQAGSAAGKGDVIGCAFSSGRACIHIISWRDGATYGCDTFFFDGYGPQDGPYLLSCFLQQFYKQTPPPDRIILPYLPQDVSDFCVMMQHLFQKSPHCTVPKRGPLFALQGQAQQQACDALMHYQSSVQEHDDILNQAHTLFSWSIRPKRIEIYDNSHHQGTDAVSVMVVQTDHQWDKKAYRTWSMDTNDDYDMMRQVIKRRFQSVKARPDFMIIDGGKGQLSAVQEALDALDLGGIPYIGIAKTQPHDTIFLKDGTPLHLAEHHPVLHWVQRMRDEAHRFAIQTHRRKRERSAFKML